jgi:hypothetical protein
MISARDELKHVVETLSEAEAEKAMALLMKHAPEMFGRSATCPCGDPNCPNPGDCDAMSRDEPEDEETMYLGENPGDTEPPAA